MKTIPSTRRFICGLFLFIFGTPFASAQADTPPWTALRQESDYKQLTPTDKVAFVCIGCKTISPIAAKSPEEAANWGKEGARLRLMPFRSLLRKASRQHPPTKT